MFPHKPLSEEDWKEAIMLLNYCVAGKGAFDYADFFRLNLVMQKRSCLLHLHRLSV